jgi:UDP-N-acetylglucosamine 2-epimerase (non-hydrolysing)
MSIAVVVGTRPEIIKLAHIVAELGDDAEVVYTGQHYDDALAGAFFDVFGMPRPHAVVEVGGRTRGGQIGHGVEALSRRWEASAPEAVVVQGDTNTALAGALAANAVEIPLVHVEAGLRSFDPQMPEEHNRVLIDHVSDLLLAPTGQSEKNLLDEGIRRTIEVTGNPVVEAVRSIMPDPRSRTETTRRHGVCSGGYVLATIHRPENTDDAGHLEAILRHLAELELPVLFPVHPRTRDRIGRFGLTALARRIEVREPLGYQEFLALAAESALLVSDSGGVQEEASVYKRPVVVVRRSTERPEVLDTFTTLASPHSFVEDVRRWLDDLEGVHDRLRATPSPYGDGEASRLSAAAIRALVA